MKKSLLALAFLVTTISCKKSIPETPKIETVKLPTDIEVSIIDPKLDTNTVQQGNPISNFLGFGYDITDKFNDHNSIRAEVVNIPLLAIEKPDGLVPAHSSTAYGLNTTAANGSDFLKLLSNRFKATQNLSVFKNTISVFLTKENAFDKKYVYGYHCRIIQLRRFKFNYLVYNFNYLTKVFEQDVKALNAAELVKKYGTHVLVDIMLGAKLNVFYQAETTHTNRDNVAETGLRYAMTKVFGIFTGYLGPMSLVHLNANTSAKLYYDVVGGDASKIEKKTLANASTIDIRKWHESVTLQNAKFIEAAENGLIPLYDLIADDNKKIEVKNYIDKYIADNEIKQ